jgi:hypothetical protein
MSWKLIIAAKAFFAALSTTILHQVVDYVKRNLVKQLLDIGVLHYLGSIHAAFFGLYLLKLLPESLHALMIPAQLFASWGLRGATTSHKGVRIVIHSFLSRRLVIDLYLFLLLVNMNHRWWVRQKKKLLCTLRVGLESRSDELVRYLEDCCLLFLLLLCFLHEYWLLD